jgi:hypothetical protein
MNGIPEARTLLVTYHATPAARPTASNQDPEQT